MTMSGDKYLIDTNVFFELLCVLSGRTVSGNLADLQKIIEGECYISEITAIEIESVIGKYARGESAHWQECGRIIGADGSKCTRQFFHAGRKKWKKRQITAMRKLMKDILEGNSNVFSVKILPLTPNVLSAAKRFVIYAYDNKFGSLDSMIAGTAKCFKGGELVVATHDAGLLNALKKDGISVFQFSPSN